MGTPIQFWEECASKTESPASCPLHCALSGTRVSSGLSRVCVMCSPKEMSRSYLDSLSGGWDMACSLFFWSGGSWRWSEMPRMRRPSEIQPQLTPRGVLWVVTLGAGPISCAG